MTQTPVQFISATRGDNCITLLVGRRRVEYYFDDSSIFRRMEDYVHEWQRNGWSNYAVTTLMGKASEVRIPEDNYRMIQGQMTPPWAKEGVSIVSDFKNTPSKEFSWTVIATTAKSLTYTNGRKWFKTEEDAKMFAGEVFELEKNQRISFDLAIVQCRDVVKPKPQVELVSTFKKESEQGT